MSDLDRELAPVSREAWREIEEQARTTLRTYLTARKLVDVEGPLGWDVSTVDLGRVERLDRAPVEAAEARRRRTQALVELRVPFRLDRDELDDVSRGAADPDLDPLVDAARELARAEDRMVFYGFDAADVRGICPGCEDDPLSATGGFGDYPRLVSEGIDVLRGKGVSGPFALALSPGAFTGLSETAVQGGYPVIEHVRRLLDGPIAWAPALQGALVLSLRGGDFELTLGRDVSIGYRNHDRDAVDLYLEESLAFRVLGPEAAVVLRPVQDEGSA